MLNSCASNTFTQQGIDIDDPRSYSRIKSDSVLKHSIALGLNHSIVFLSLDGEWLGNFWSKHGAPLDLIVTPGNHTVSFRYHHYYSTAENCFEFEAKPSKTYVIRKNIGEKSVLFWLEDDTGLEQPFKECGE